jgi:hypothetical protein
MLAGKLRKALRRPRPRPQVIETPEAFGERCWDELIELIEQGEISASFAERVRTDMFEPAAPGRPPRLRRRYRDSYLRQITGDYS